LIVRRRPAVTDQFAARGSQSVGIEDSVQHAAELILRHRVHRLVVLDEQRRVVGVVSTMDLLAAYVEGDGG